MTANQLIHSTAKNFVDKSQKLLFLVRQLQSVNAVSKDIIVKAVFSAIGKGEGRKKQLKINMMMRLRDQVIEIVSALNAKVATGACTY